MEGTVIICYFISYFSTKQLGNQEIFLVLNKVFLLFHRQSPYVKRGLRFRNFSSPREKGVVSTMFILFKLVERLIYINLPYFLYLIVRFGGP